MVTRKRTTTAAVTPEVPIKKPESVTLGQAIASLKKRTIEQMAQQVNILDADEVGRVLIKDLNAAKQDVLLKVLGLDNRWGRYEVDHCNGRENPINATINAHCKPLIQEWVKEGITEFLTNNKERLKKEYKDALIKDVKDKMRPQYRFADELTSEIIAEIKAEAMAEAKAELKKQMEST